MQLVMKRLNLLAEGRLARAAEVVLKCRGCGSQVHCRRWILEATFDRCDGIVQEPAEPSGDGRPLLSSALGDRALDLGLGRDVPDGTGRSSDELTNRCVGGTGDDGRCHKFVPLAPAARLPWFLHENSSSR